MTSALVVLGIALGVVTVAAIIGDAVAQVVDGTSQATATRTDGLSSIGLRVSLGKHLGPRVSWCETPSEFVGVR